MKALVSQANAQGMTSDGYHHFEQPEQELLSKYANMLSPPVNL